MKEAEELNRDELVRVVAQIQAILYLDEESESWDRDKEWDTGTIERVDEVLRESGLCPEEGGGPEP